MPGRVKGGMRGMKERQLGRKPLVKGETKPAAEPEGAPEPEEELEEPMEEGMLVDQGDGTRVLRRGVRRSPEDRDTHECPDEPPEGWGEG